MRGLSRLAIGVIGSCWLFVSGTSTPINAVEIPKPVITIPRPVINVPRPNVTVNVPRPGINVPRPTVTVPKVDVPRPTIAVTVPKVDVARPTVAAPKIDVPKPNIVVNTPKVDVPHRVVDVPKVEAPKSAIAVTVPKGAPPNRTVDSFRFGPPKSDGIAQRPSDLMVNTPAPGMANEAKSAGSVQRPSDLMVNVPAPGALSDAKSTGGQLQLSTNVPRLQTGEPGIVKGTNSTVMAAPKLAKDLSSGGGSGAPNKSIVFVTDPKPSKELAVTGFKAQSAAAPSNAKAANSTTATAYTYPVAPNGGCTDQTCKPGTYTLPPGNPYCPNGCTADYAGGGKFSNGSPLSITSAATNITVANGVTTITDPTTGQTTTFATPGTTGTFSGTLTNAGTAGQAIMVNAGGTTATLNGGGPTTLSGSINGQAVTETRVNGVSTTTVGGAPVVACGYSTCNVTATANNRPNAPPNQNIGSPDGFAIGHGRSDYDGTIYVARPGDPSASLIGTIGNTVSAQRPTLSSAPQRSDSPAELPEPPETGPEKLGNELTKELTTRTVEAALKHWAPTAAESLEILSRANFWFGLTTLALSPTSTVPNEMDQPSKSDLIKAMMDAQSRSWSQQRAQQLQALTADPAAPSPAPISPGDAATLARP